MGKNLAGLIPGKIGKKVMLSFSEQRYEPYGSYQRTLWAMVMWSLLILMLLLVSCATVSSSRKYVNPVLDSNIPVKTAESFSVLWDKWTVHFGASARGGKLLSLMNPLTMTGGRGGGNGEFPLDIDATLMDSSLIEAGLQYYANLLKMIPEEKTAFRSAYFKRYDVENHLLIWCELRTTWTELFLDLDRWIIFIEDDAINQHEPVRILNESQSSRETVTDSLPGFPTAQRRQRWEIHQKSLMLCFPKRDLLKNPILSEKLRFLKLIFQLKDDEKIRADGTWVFKK